MPQRPVFSPVQVKKLAGPPAVPTFQLRVDPAFPPSVNRLPLSFTIDGVTCPTPILRYKGGDAGAGGWNAWGYGPNLALQAGDVPTYNVGSPFCEAEDDAVRFNNGGYFQSATPVDIGTKDFVIEAIFKCDDNQFGGSRILETRTALGQSGIYLYQVGAGLTNAAGTTVSVSWSSGQALKSNSWNVVYILCNRDWDALGSLHMCYNKCDLSSHTYFNANAYALRADSLTGDQLVLGASYNAGVKSRGDLAYLTVWAQADWLVENFDYTSACRERVQRLTALWPQLATGDPLYGGSSRSTAALADRIISGERRLFSMGAYLPRISQRDDALGSPQWGLLSEGAMYNRMGYSQNFGTQWAKETAGDAVTEGATRSPDGETVGVNASSSLVADATAGAHGIYRASTAITAANHVLSIYIRPGTARWWCLENTTTVVDCRAWFDLQLGVVGAKGVGVVLHGVEGPFLDGHWRVYLQFMGTAAAHTCVVRPVDGDGVLTYSGGNGADIQGYLWGCQVEGRTDWPTSYSRSTGSGAFLRQHEVLTYSATNITPIGVGSIVYDYVGPGRPGGESTGGESTYGPFRSAAVSAQTIKFYIDPDGTARVEGGGGNEISVGVVNDNLVHELKVTWSKAHRRFALYIDGLQQGAGPDLSSTVAEAATSLQLFHQGRDTNGLINNIRVYDRLVPYPQNDPTWGPT